MKDTGSKDVPDSIFKGKLLRLFINDEIIISFVSETNKYRRMKKRRGANASGYSDVNRGEGRHFLGNEGLYSHVDSKWTDEKD